MLLRRMTQHVKDQNWFASEIDFPIGVIGESFAPGCCQWNRT
jgi:hypothetical protein